MWCCVDKEGILSLPNPCAEKVFFLKSRKHKLKEELAGKPKSRKESTCTWTSEVSRQSSSQDGQESSDNDDEDDDGYGDDDDIYVSDSETTGKRILISSVTFLSLSFCLFCENNLKHAVNTFNTKLVQLYTKKALFN